MIASWLWSIRRELWEHRWVYLVPAAFGAVLILFGAGLVLAKVSMPLMVGVARTIGLDPRGIDPSMMVDLQTRMLLVTGTIIAFIYCAEALHGERRDRSILFWKSLPVSDATAVWAKASIPLLVSPLVTMVVIMVAQLVTRALLSGSGIALSGRLTDPGDTILEVWVTALWQAPLYGWILLASGWARRAPLVWAFMPLVLLTMMQRLVSAESVVAEVLAERGPFRHWPRTTHWPNPNAQYDMRMAPADVLLTDPALWIGVAVAIAFIVAASRLRRWQRPL